MGKLTRFKIQDFQSLGETAYYGIIQKHLPEEKQKMALTGLGLQYLDLCGRLQLKTYRWQCSSMILLLTLFPTKGVWSLFKLNPSHMSD